MEKCTKCEREFVNPHGLKVHNTTIHRDSLVLADDNANPLCVVENKMLNTLNLLLDSIGMHHIRKANFREKFTAIGILSDKLLRRENKTSITPIQINIQPTNIADAKESLMINVTPNTESA